MGSEVPGASRRGQPSLLKELNQQAVLNVVFRHGPVSRSEIATRAGLSKPTVSAALSRLMRSGLVVEAGMRTGAPGRVAALFAVDSRVAFVVGVDVGARRIRVALANIYGETLREEEHPTDERGGAAIIDQIAELAAAVAERGGVARDQLPAVCVSTPGIVDPAARTVRLARNIPGWDEPELHSRLEALLGRPPIIENDINLAAVGEKWKGLGRDVDTFVFVSVGSGIGMGIVVGDELYRGVHGGAGEIGFLPLADDPFDPRHQGRGPLEDTVATIGVMAAVARATGWDGPKPTSVAEVFALAELGSAPARAIVDDEARRVGLAAASVAAVVDPELIILGGGIGMNPLLLGPVRDVVARLAPTPPRVERSLLGEKAALTGAIARALQEARATLFAPRGEDEQPAAAPPRRERSQSTRRTTPRR